jgi:hypothetical protein
MFHYLERNYARRMQLDECRNRSDPRKIVKGRRRTNSLFGESRLII